MFHLAVVRELVWDQAITNYASDDVLPPRCSARAPALARSGSGLMFRRAVVRELVWDQASTNYASDDVLPRAVARERPLSPVRDRAIPNYRRWRGTGPRATGTEARFFRCGRGTGPRSRFLILAILIILDILLQTL